MQKGLSVEFQKLCRSLEENDNSLKKVSLDLNGSMMAPLGHALLGNTVVTELELNINILNRYEVCLGPHSSMLLEFLQKAPVLKKISFTTSRAGVPALNASFMSLCVAHVAENKSISHLDIEAIAWRAVDMQNVFTAPCLVELTLTGYACSRLQEKLERGEMKLRIPTLETLRLERPNSLSAAALLHGLAMSTTSLRRVVVTELECYNNLPVAYAIQHLLEESLLLQELELNGVHFHEERFLPFEPIALGLKARRDVNLVLDSCDFYESSTDILRDLYTDSDRNSCCKSLTLAGSVRFIGQRRGGSVEMFLKSILHPFGSESNDNEITHVGLRSMSAPHTMACLQILSGRRLESLYIDILVGTLRDLDVASDNSLCSTIVHTLPTLRNLHELKIVLRNIQSLPLFRPRDYDIYYSILSGLKEDPFQKKIRLARTALVQCVPMCPKLLRADILTVADDGSTLIPFLDVQELQWVRRYCRRHAVLPKWMTTPVAKAPTTSNPVDNCVEDIPLYLWPRLLELAQRRDDANDLIFECLMVRGNDLLADASSAVMCEPWPTFLLWKKLWRNMDSLIASRTSRKDQTNSQQA